jgi:hypothetical protein
LESKLFVRYLHQQNNTVMTTTRIFIDKSLQKFEAITKQAGNNPSVIRQGAIVPFITLTNLGFESIEQYVLKSYPNAEITYCEL